MSISMELGNGVEFITEDDARLFGGARLGCDFPSKENDNEVFVCIASKPQTRNGVPCDEDEDYPSVYINGYANIDALRRYCEQVLWLEARRLAIKEQV